MSLRCFPPVRVLLPLCILLGAPRCDLKAADPAKPEISISAGWDSKYVSEGRDNLREGGLASATIDVGWLGFGFTGWYAHGDRVNYRELNLAIARTFVLGPLELTTSYTRLEFAGEGEAPGDNEFGAGLALPLPQGFTCEAGVRYSTEADGAFFELAVRRPCPVGTQGIVVTPYLLQGIDHGYATSGHHGANHLEGGILVECPLHEDCTLSVYCARCWAQRDVHLSGGGDVTWFGLSLTTQL